MVIIRPATDKDWPQIYPFYATTMAAGETYAFPPGQSLDDARPWWMEQPPGLTVVAVGEEGSAGDGAQPILGSARMGPNRPGRGSHIATASFLVNTAHRGGGVGRALGEHMIAWAREQGYHGIQFNAVVETNHAAVHLWRSLGFEIIGTVPDAFDHATHGLVGLHVMYLPLTDPTR